MTLSIVSKNNIRKLLLMVFQLTSFPFNTNNKNPWRQQILSLSEEPSFFWDWDISYLCFSVYTFRRNGMMWIYVNKVLPSITPMLVNAYQIQREETLFFKWFTWNLSSSDRDIHRLTYIVFVFNFLGRFAFQYWWSAHFNLSRRTLGTFNPWGLWKW